jgi:hypothetical protein
MATMEKNERLKRSIHEKLYSSASMPDLLQRDEDVKKVDTKIKILTGVLVDESTDFVTVDEITPKRPIRVKMRRAPSIPVQQKKNEQNSKKEEQEIEPIQSPKPPTPPVRRQSRSNSLRASQKEILSAQQIPPLVMPRRNINQNFVTIESIDDDSNDQENQIKVEQPKSILKTGEDNHTTKGQHITFVNVPDSSSSSDDDEENQDVWTRIDMHRNQLKRLQEMESASHFDESESSTQESEMDETPPLPKTPPPIVDEQPYLRDFSFA